MDLLPAVGRMRQRLRVDFAAAHFFDIQRDFFSVLQFLIAAQLLQVHLLNFAVLRPDDFTRGRVHRHRWFLSAQLESGRHAAFLRFTLSVPIDDGP